MSGNLHDYVLDHADALADLAEAKYAEALEAGRTEEAGRWAAMLEAVCQAVRAVRPVLHGPEGVRSA